MLSKPDILNANLLIVDDQEVNIRLLEETLRNAGYTRITSTQNPYEVCELHRKNHYDLILLDLLMPDMDGFQVLEGLKNIETEWLPSGTRDYRPAGSQTARVTSWCERLHQQAV